MKYILAALFILLSISDILSTRIALKLGYYEKNWIVLKLVEEFGYKGHYIVKGITLVLFLLGLNFIDLHALAILNIAFALIVVHNLWKISHASH
jgi:hypothetical protein